MIYFQAKNLILKDYSLPISQLQIWGIFDQEI